MINIIPTGHAREAANAAALPKRRHAKPLTWAQAFRKTRPFLLLIALGTLSGYTFLSGPTRASDGAAASGEIVQGEFSPCGPRANSLCVVDGDTFRIHHRRVRVVGIDTAERQSRCASEAALAAQSTRALQQWLNRGPFTMAPNPARAVDRYGRELQIVTRVAADGQVDALADWMQAEGGARPYGGGARSGWC